MYKPKNNIDVAVLVEFFCQLWAGACYLDIELIRGHSQVENANLNVNLTFKLKSK